jgi:energy-coupling factor transport system permease protein
MLVTWRYRERKSLIQSFDPRAWWIFYACYLASVLLFWDARFLAFFLAVALFFVFTSHITWQESRRAWKFIGIFILFYATLTFLTGRGGMEVYTQEHLMARLVAPFTLFGWQPAINVTAERSFFAISQMLRVFSIASLTILIPYALNPALYGVAFRGLGLPDKIAYAMDLTMRFVPTFGRDFQLTLDAQRARGYEIENLRGGLIAQVRKMAPLIVPVTIHAIIGSEDIIDAMDLRAFGIGPRTWLEELHYRRRDRVLIALGVLLLTVSLGITVGGAGNFWVPPALIENTPPLVSIGRDNAIKLAIQECGTAYDEELAPPQNVQAHRVSLGKAYELLGMDPTYEERSLSISVWLVSMEGSWLLEGPPSSSGSQPSTPNIFHTCSVILAVHGEAGTIVSSHMPH